MFENKQYEGIYYSRFLASWCNAGGSFGQRTGWLFKDWLRQLIINGKPIPEEIVNDIYNYASNGKMELEGNAKVFLAKQRD